MGQVIQENGKMGFLMVKGSLLQGKKFTKEILEKEEK